MPSDAGADPVCALNLVPEGTSGAREVRPYGKRFSCATYERASHSTASFRLSGRASCRVVPALPGARCG